VRRREPELDFYSRIHEEDEYLALAKAAGLEGIHQEITLLRVLIRRHASAGEMEKARRAIESLCKALKVQYSLSDRATDNLAHSLARVLDEIGNEIGMAL